MSPKPMAFYWSWKNQYFLGYTAELSWLLCQSSNNNGFYPLGIGGIFALAFILSRQKTFKKVSHCSVFQYLSHFPGLHRMKQVSTLDLQGGRGRQKALDWSSMDAQRAIIVNWTNFQSWKMGWPRLQSLPFPFPKHVTGWTQREVFLSSARAFKINKRIYCVTCYTFQATEQRH